MYNVGEIEAIGDVWKDIWTGKIHERSNML